MSEEPSAANAMVSSARSERESTAGKDGAPPALATIGRGGASPYTHV
jgi:hypothetical protein